MLNYLNTHNLYQIIIIRSIIINFNSILVQNLIKDKFITNDSTSTSELLLIFTKIES